MDTLNRIVLTTENGYEPSNTIVLEPEVYAALEQFVMSAGEEASNEQ